MYFWIFVVSMSKYKPLGYPIAKLQILLSLLFHLRMRHRQWQARLREIEHVENGRLGATVLTVVNSPDHLDHGLARMDDLLCPVLGDDGQFTFHQHAVVHHRMVMPVKLLSDGKNVFLDHQFGAAFRIVWEFRTVPALRGADKVFSFHLHIIYQFWFGKNTKIYFSYLCAPFKNRLLKDETV